VPDSVTVRKGVYDISEGTVTPETQEKALLVLLAHSVLLTTVSECSSFVHVVATLFFSGLLEVFSIPATSFSTNT
jgi:hypothetical protein